MKKSKIRRAVLMARLKQPFIKFRYYVSAFLYAIAHKDEKAGRKKQKRDTRFLDAEAARIAAGRPKIPYRRVAR